ncbi:endo-1,4-beta-xylanase [Streptomyces radiopugnans]|uniref:Beta-xylanase n=1 Tax=Streptomyces radiopugnans TaxID=403935 RepID=A0A1H8Z762_9ACTN|nr:endo-1,4-beta-xylanase [Streptomyces radiopugnans]SEP60309.1 endo-1,4-beta-xylanase [Streptomyces radiopugnans]
MRQHRVRTVRRLARAAVAASAAAAALTFGFSAPSQAADPSLREVAESTGRFIGTAVNDGLLSNGTYSDIVSTEFDSVTAENAMKWEAVEPQRGQFNWAGGDRLVQFAQANDQLVYGHTLVWHSQMPGWLQNGSFSNSELRTIVTDHVTTQVSRYKDKVQRWDVVNEAFNEDGSLRQSKFYQQLGASYIADSFRAARAADPDAKLFINDYNTETANAKSDGLYRLVRDLKAQGVPIDGVGFQNHLIVGQVNGQAIRQNLQRFADLGLEVAVTELDIRMRMPSDSSKLQQQARDYRAVADACLAVSRCSGITVWGVSDRDSWVPDVFDGEGAACPWDENYRPKPAYDALRDAFVAAGGDPGDPDDPDNPGDPDPPTGDCSAAFTVSNRWDTGSVVSVTIRTGQALNGWRAQFDLPAGVNLANGWNGAFSQSGRTVTVSNAAYNGTVSAGGTISFGFQTSGGAAQDGTRVSLGGQECAAG